MPDANEIPHMKCCLRFIVLARVCSADDGGESIISLMQSTIAESKRLQVAKFYQDW